MSSIDTRLKKIERQLGVGYDIKRTVLILGHPKQERETKTEMSETENAERDTRINRLIQEKIRRDPKNPFIFILA